MAKTFEARRSPRERSTIRSEDRDHPVDLYNAKFTGPPGVPEPGSGFD